MSTLLTILSVLFGLGNLVLFIIVLIKLFKEEGTGKGILGLICSLYTFVWGWMKHKELEITNIMIAWTGCIVVQVLLSVIANAIVASQLR